MGRPRGLWLVACGLMFMIILSAVSCQLSAVYAQPISGTELINNAKDYDGKAVVFEGEAIGEVMLRGGYAWVNLNDGSSAIGIWMPKEMADTIKYTGSYQYRGDWVEVAGVFNRACPEHGGDLDIHAQGISKTLPGRQLKKRININKVNMVYILSGALALVWILKLLQRR